MKSILKSSAILLSILLLGGCLQVHTVVTVNPDGSGTVKETLVFGRQLAVMMRAFEGVGEESKKSRGVFDEEKLRQEAAKMGEGVSFVSAKPIRLSDGEGYEAVYAFKDISTLRLNQNPGGKISGAAEGLTPTSRGDSKAKDQFVSFQFTKGTPATLVIRLPERKEAEAKREPDEQRDDPDEDDIQMARMMLGDLRISMAVECAGTIVETNASFRKGSTVTLVEIDFGQLLSDESFLRDVRSYDNLSKEEAKKLMQKHPGLKIELNDEVRVRFRK